MRHAGWQPQRAALIGATSGRGFVASRIHRRRLALWPLRLANPTDRPPLVTPALAVVAAEQPRVCDVLYGSSLAYGQVNVGLRGGAGSRAPTPAETAPDAGSQTGALPELPPPLITIGRSRSARTAPNLNIDHQF